MTTFPSYPRWCLTFVLGVLGSRFLSIVLPIQIGEFSFEVSSAAFLILIWCALRIAQLPIHRLNQFDLYGFVFSSAITLDQLVYLIVRTDPNQHEFGSVALAGSFILGGLFLSLSAYLFRSNAEAPSTYHSPRKTTSVIIFFILIQLITFFAYRVINSHLVQQGVPNEERSVFLFGFEVHHLVWGNLLVVLGCLFRLFLAHSKCCYVFGWLLIAASIPMITDEILYYFYTNVTDELYFDVPSFSSGAIASALVIAIFGVRFVSTEPVDSPTNRLTNFVRPFVLVILPVVAVLQLVLIFYAVASYDLWLVNSGGMISTHVQTETIAKGFLNDFFYTAWNLFPLVLWGYYLALNRYGAIWYSSIRQKFNSKTTEQCWTKVRNCRDHWLPISLIVIVCLYSCISQSGKQEDFIESGSHLYWWDIRLSAFTYWVRYISLFANMFLVVYIFWVTFLYMAKLAWLAFTNTITVQCLHPDTHCGFRNLGYLLYLLVMPWVIMAFVGVLGMLDHGTLQGTANLLGDTLMIVLPSLIAIGFFSFTSWRMHIRMKQSLDQARARVFALTNMDQLEEAITSNQNSGLSETVEKNGQYLALAKELDSVKEWPFSVSQLIQVVLLIGTPLFALLKPYLDKLYSLWF